MASFLLRRRLTTTIRSMSTTCTKKSPSTSPSPPPPWLMLPPLFKGGHMVYNFYSPADEKAYTFNKRRRGTGGGVISDPDQIPPDNAKFVGSSHGWLASFDENSNHVFLSNPISGRHMKLPAIDTLPDPHLNLCQGRGSVSRVIVSDEKPSHALMSYGPCRKLALSAPGLSTGWTPLIHEHNDEDWEHEDLTVAPRPWEDMLYCTRRRVFSTIQPLSFDERGNFVRDEYGRQPKHCEMYHWNIIPFGGYDGDSHICCCGGNWDDNITKQCIQMPHLVNVEQLSDLPLIVMRFMYQGVGDNASPSDQKFLRQDLYRAHINTFPYRSQNFLVLEAGIFCNVVEDLKGLALFVGMNHSFAVEATGKLRPNSIYFTDAGRITPPDPDAPMIYGGHDIGIFDYEKKTISPCYYPCDLQSFKRIDPPPMWFTPTFN